MNFKNNRILLAVVCLLVIGLGLAMYFSLRTKPNPTTAGVQTKVGFAHGHYYNIAANDPVRIVKAAPLPKTVSFKHPVKGTPHKFSTTLSQFQNFVNHIQSSTFYNKWVSQNSGEATTWGSYRNSILSGASPIAPSLTTFFGKALVDAGQLYLASVPPPSGSPNLFVSPSGSDSNNCTSVSTPCLTLQRAYLLAGNDAVIQMAAGTYTNANSQLVTNNGNITTGHNVVFQPPSGASNSAVTITRVDLKGSNNITFKNITFGDGTPSNIAYYNIYSSNTVCDGCQIHGMLDIDGGASAAATPTSTNLVFQNGCVCNWIARNGDPQFGGLRGPTFPAQAVPTNLQFINESFHDIDSDNTTSHTECMQILSVHGLTVRNTKFYRCNYQNGTSSGSSGSKNGMQFSGFQCQNIKPNSEANCGTMNDYYDVTVENSMLNGGPAGSNQNPISSDDQFGDVQDCKNWVVRNNSMIGAVLWGCNLGGINGGAAASTVKNNIFSIGSPGFINSECIATFTYNIWETGGTGCGGSPALTGSVSYVDRSSNPTFDLHLNAGSFGLAAGDPGSFPTTDYDGQLRPIPAATSPDIGADER